MHRGSEARIPASAAPTPRYYKLLIGSRKLKHLLAGFVVVDYRADGDFEHNLAPIPPGLV